MSDDGMSRAGSYSSHSIPLEDVGEDHAATTQDGTLVSNRSPTPNEEDGTSVSNRSPTPNEEVGMPVSNRSPTPNEEDGTPVSNRSPTPNERDGTPVSNGSPTPNEHIATTEDYEMLVSHHSAMLDEDHDNAVTHELKCLRSQCSSAEEEFAMLDARAAYLQICCEKAMKAKEEISAKIKKLKERIRERKEARLAELSIMEQHLEQEFHSLTQQIWTPVALESMAAGLRAQKQEVEQECKYLDEIIERKEAELLQVRMQRAENNADEDILKPEEYQVAYQTLKEDGARLQELLDQLTLKKQELEEDIECLSLS